MSSLDELYPGLVAALADRYGRPATAPGGVEPFAAAVAVVLGRAAGSAKVDAAVAALRDAGWLDPAALAAADPAELAGTVAGLPTTSLGPLRRLAEWWGDGPGDAATESLRDDLRAIRGIGPATADAILLHALGRPAYPVDRATYRIFVRHGWLDATADYDEARDRVERLDPDDPSALARLESWFERVGRDACRATVAKCDRCPLRPFLPPGGLIEGE